MKQRIPRLLNGIFAALFATALAWAAPDKETVVHRARVELATILKKEAAKLPVDKPVTELGADDLDVVEWVMAMEEAFHIAIPEEKIAGRSGKGIRTDLTIAIMAGIVVEQATAGGGKKRSDGK
jgi:acyl carrier protein